MQILQDRRKEEDIGTEYFFINHKRYSLAFTSWPPINTSFACSINNSFDTDPEWLQ